MSLLLHDDRRSPSALENTKNWNKNSSNEVYDMKVTESLSKFVKVRAIWLTSILYQSVAVSDSIFNILAFKSYPILQKQNKLIKNVYEFKDEVEVDFPQWDCFSFILDILLCWEDICLLHTSQIPTQLTLPCPNS